MTDNTKLSERAMIASLHLGIWSGFKIDPEVTDETTERYKAEKGSGKYTKRLVAPKFIQNVARTATLARQTHRLLTLPWDDNGDRILSGTGYLHYTEQMRLRRINFQVAVTEFVEGLPEYIREGKVRLGNTFDENDYPTSAELADKFSYDVEIKPVHEAGDFRTKIGEASIKAIIKDNERRINARIEAAMQDVFMRIEDVTAKMVERLRAFKPATEDGRIENPFRDTLVSNLAETAALLPSLNITNDPRIDALHKALLQELTAHSPEILRTDTKIRTKTADKAEQILAKVRRYLA